jgi:uncharacterized membrane protein
MTIVAAIAVVRANARAIATKIILIAARRISGLSGVTLAGARYIIVNGNL